jgi:hypothetical protein
LCKESVIGGVRSDPIPHDQVPVTHADGPITDANPRRVKGRIGMDLLEVETRMGGVLPEQSIRLPNLSLNVGW